MLAELGCVRVTWIAHFKAEHASADKVDPFDHLGVLGVSCEVARVDDGLEGGRVHSEGVGEDNTAKGIALFICTVWVEF